MPKLKTKSGAAKRFKKTATGQFKCSHSHASHILTKKSPKRKRNLRKSAILHKSDSASAQKMLPYA